MGIRHFANNSEESTNKRRSMKILVIGPRQCGKTVAGDYLAKTIGCDKSISTSDILIDEYIADLAKNGIIITKELILANKDAHREALWSLGRKLQKDNPAHVAQLAINRATKNGNCVITGVRNRDEMCVLNNRMNRIFDIIYYIQRDGCTDSTFFLSPDQADVVIYNNAAVDDLYKVLETSLAARLVTSR